MTQRRSAIAVVSLLGGFVILLMWFSVLSRHAFAANSDSATVLLEGNAIRHGNFALAAWTFAWDSFWTIDAVAYSLATAIAGVTPSLLHTVPAGIAAATVLVGVVLATRSCATRLGRLVGATSVLLVLALPSHALSYFFLQGPWHVGTAAYCLIAFALLARPGGLWRWCAAIALLGAAMLGDLQTAALGVVPVALAGCMDMVRTRSAREGIGLVLVAPASVVLALLMRAISVRAGAFAINAGHHTASWQQMVANPGRALSWAAALLGLHAGPYGGPGVPTIVHLAHFAGSAVVVAGVVGGIVSLGRGFLRAPPSRQRAATRLDDLLLFAIAGDLACFELLTLSGNTLYARYLTAAVVFAAVLGGRTCARLAEASWVTIAERARHLWLVAGSLLVVASVLAAYVSEDLGQVSAASSVPPTRTLGRFLASHDLHLGLGEYWAASVVTVGSRGKVAVRPVAANVGGRIVRDGRQTSSGWYDGKRFQFVVWDRLPYDRVTPANVARTWGVPATVWHVGQYTVAVFDRPIRISQSSVP